MTVEDLATELKRIEESADYSSQTQFEQAKLWRIGNWLFGLPAAALAAVAGGAGLSDLVGLKVTAAMALGAAGLGAIATTLSASKRAEEARIAGNRYLGLRNDARRMRQIDIHASQAYEAARDALQQLCDREAEVGQIAPLPSRVAFWLARRNIDKGRTSFEVDR